LAKALTAPGPGCRIRVREQQGDAIILIGAAAASKFAAPAVG
jgi:hypothetical protein